MMAALPMGFSSSGPLADRRDTLSLVKVYIAGATAEIERAKKWHQRLTEVGIEVVSTWITNVEAVGIGNPRHAAREERASWARTCLREAAQADVLWLLTPGPEARTAGAWYESGFVYGIARADGPTLIASGDTKQTIFTALADEYPNDIDAFIAIIRLSKC
jgi:LmbE family N-acetylglucosaminyl deacetylase